MIPPAKIPILGQTMKQQSGVSVFLWGHMGSRKTSWCAGWPGVVFFSIQAEGGDKSLLVWPQVAQWMCDRSKLECPPVFNKEKPPVFPIRHSGTPQTARRFLKKQYTDAECLGSAWDMVERNYKQWGICTIVFDSLTFLVDLWIDDLLQHRYGDSGDSRVKDKAEERGGDLLGPPDWNMLNHYIRQFRVRAGKMGINVIWTALQKDIYETDTRNQMKKNHKQSIPMITGQTQVKLPAQCDLHLWAQNRVTPAGADMPGRYVNSPVFYTSPNRLNENIRHRFGFLFPQGKLVDPEFGDEPTFRAVWSALHPFIYTGQ